MLNKKKPNNPKQRKGNKNKRYTPLRKKVGEKATLFLLSFYCSPRQGIVPRLALT